MDKNSTVRELLRQITGTEKPQAVFHLMEVVSVDGDLCLAKMGDFEIPYIRLSAIAGGSENGILVTPTVGSIVLVADLSSGQLRDMAIVGFSEIDSIRIHKGKTTITTDGSEVSVEVGGSRMQISDGLIAFNGGDLRGLIKIGDLTDKINELIDAFNGHTHEIPSGGVAVTGSATAQANPGPVTVPAIATPHANVQISDYENTKVKH